MSAGPTNEEIKEALAQSGYLMEQEVATQLEKLGYHVWTNAPFQDPDEGKSREMDVRAVQRFAYDEERKVSAFVEVIAECKNSDNPYVFITRAKNISDNNCPPKGWMFPLGQYEMKKAIDQSRSHSRQTPAFFHLGYEAVKSDYLANDKAVQFCRIDRTGRNIWQANHGGLYDSIFFPMAKAVTSRIADAPKSGAKPDEWKYFWFIFPIVILSGRILKVDTTMPELEPTDVDFINFRRELKSNSLDGRFSVDFVRQSALEAYHAACVVPTIEYTTRLMAEQLDMVLTKDIPWVERD
jgi:hypothetical protein